MREARNVRGRRISGARVAALLVIAVGAVFAVGLGTYFFVVRGGDAPPPVSLSANPATPGATRTATGTPVAATNFIGTWQVKAGSNSFVGYRVVEQLAGIGTNTAVGRTSGVTGSLEFDGSAITGVDVTADMTTLKSDDDRRDGQLRNGGIQYATYPTSRFVLSEPIALAAVPAIGQIMTASAKGNLTLHGVTQAVSLDMQGQLTDANTFAVVGSTPITFADYSMTAPRAGAVLSVEDHGVLEIQLVFTK